MGLKGWACMPRARGEIHLLRAQAGFQRGVSRGLGWRIHESVEDTKLSTNKQLSLSHPQLRLFHHDHDLAPSPLWIVPHNALSLSLSLSLLLTRASERGQRMPRAIEVQVPLSMYWRHRYAELTCQPILCRHYASMTQDGLQIAGGGIGGASGEPR
jgi:hypothetical protein